MDTKRSARPRQDDVKKEFSETVIQIDRVARVVKGGRRFRFRALVVVGDNKNRVGVGSSKGADVQAAVAKAVDVAKKNLITVPLYRETIPHETMAKVGGANVLLKPAARGTGVIAGGTIRAILDSLNVHNVLTKSLGSSNKTNVAYATIEALKALKPASEWLTYQNKEAKPKTKAKKESK